jgi:hypothetical protein
LRDAEAWAGGSALALALFATSCNPATSRPAFLPHPESSAQVVQAGRLQLVAQVAAWLDTAGLTVVAASPRDGYVETDWGQPAQHDSSGSSRRRDRIKLRAWVDPDVTGSSRLVVEAVYRPLVDRSRPARELEVPVPDSHPGARLVRELLEAMRQRFGTPAGGHDTGVSGRSTPGPTPPSFAGRSTHRGTARLAAAS